MLLSFRNSLLRRFNLITYCWLTMSERNINGCVQTLFNLHCIQIKGLTREERESRCDLVIALADRLQAIPDGNEHGAKQANSDWGGASAPNKNIKFDMSGSECFFFPFMFLSYHKTVHINEFCFILLLLLEEDMDDGFFQQSEESSQFRQEYEMRRKKQVHEFYRLAFILPFDNEISNQLNLCLYFRMRVLISYQKVWMH